MPCQVIAPERVTAVKYVFAILVLAAAGLLASATAQTAQATPATAAGYTCTYRSATSSFIVFYRVSGADNGPSMCRTFASGWSNDFRRYYGSWLPTKRCMIQNEDSDLRITVYARLSYVGNYLCDGMETDGWYRI